MNWKSHLFGREHLEKRAYLKKIVQRGWPTRHEIQHEIQVHNLDQLWIKAAHTSPRIPSVFIIYIIELYIIKYALNIHIYLCFIINYTFLNPSNTSNA